VEIIEHPPILHIPAIPDHILYTWIVMGILVVVSFVATRRVALVPTGGQNFMELVLDQFLKELDETIGHEGRRYLPLIATLGLFILTSNLMGLIPGLVAPTANLNTTAACALIVFITYHVIGVRKQGFIPYMKHLMFVIEIISHCARPLSLSLRLFGNMMAGHILLAIFFFMMGFDGMLGWALSGTLGGIVVGAPAAIIMVVFVVGFLFPLKILVAFIQTFIFCKLAMLYIAAAVEEAEHH
jgi:F-type H+-transporting ATPase subunit a